MAVRDQKKQLVLAGLQPSAGIQIGNFLGAIRSWAAMQSQKECLFFLADMHAITVQQRPELLSANTLDGVAMYLACGIDPEKSTVFLQSQVVGHSDLAWVLACNCSLGQLERMTQFKEKVSQKKAEFIGAGLLYYPILMAADILLYDADLVPVGEDQRQHLELARDLAERFNNNYGHTFTIPNGYYAENCTRVMSLQSPSMKMSKSDPNPAGVVFLTDTDQEIRKKFRSAVTDSGKEIRALPEKPGISNLIGILSGLTETDVCKIEERYVGATYSRLKEDIAEAAVSVIAPIREKFFTIRERKDVLLGALEHGRIKAQQMADRMLENVYKCVGFLDRRVERKKIDSTRMPRENVVAV
jgi:tryptophanyl-tRNA synthetase